MGMLEDIINPLNLNAAYRKVRQNRGSGGVDRMTVDELLPYLKLHGGEIVRDLLDGRYMPCPSDGWKSRRTTAKCANSESPQPLTG